MRFMLHRFNRFLCIIYIKINMIKTWIDDVVWKMHVEVWYQVTLGIQALTNTKKNIQEHNQFRKTRKIVSHVPWYVISSKTQSLKSDLPKLVSTKKQSVSSEWMKRTWEVLTLVKLTWWKEQFSNLTWFISYKIKIYKSQFSDKISNWNFQFDMAWFTKNVSYSHHIF